VKLGTFERDLVLETRARGREKKVPSRRQGLKGPKKRGMYAPASPMGDASAASVLVPTRFMWPHGGRHVHLCGSFHTVRCASLHRPFLPSPLLRP